MTPEQLRQQTETLREPVRWSKGPPVRTLVGDEITARKAERR